MNNEIGNDTPFKTGNYDGLLYSNETGFSPLSRALPYLDLKKNHLVARVLKEADEEPMVAGLKFKESIGSIKGIIIASGKRSQAHQKYVQNAFSRPYRDFFYIMHYLAFELAERYIGCDHLGVTHLTGGGEMKYYNDVAKCATEALIHYQNKHPESELDPIFTGCCLKEYHFHGLDEFAESVDKTAHKPIAYKTDFNSDRTVELKLLRPTIGTV